MDTFSSSFLSRRERQGLRDTLAELLRGVGYCLGPNIVGVYIVGSFALGAGDSQSDVDFAVVTHRSISAGELTRLRNLHETLPDAGTFGADHLEGSYLPLDDLAGIPSSEWLYIDNGSRILEPSRHDNTHAFRWVLREKSTALFGPAAHTFTTPVDDFSLRREARDRAIEWRDLLRSTPSTVDDSWAQTHFVTGLCRLLYTWQEGAITSKHEATHWALRRLGLPWQELLSAALAQRPTTWARVGEKADPSVAARTIALAEEICIRLHAAEHAGRNRRP